jgi:hypothetical protein
MINTQCKINGCENESIALKGRYARLCETHTEEAKLRYGKAGHPRKQLEAPKLKDTAIRLIEISERIDNSAAQFRESKNSLLMDINHFNRILEDLKMRLKYIVNSNAD